MIRDDPEALAMFREAMVERRGGDRRSDHTKSDIVTFETSDERGNSRAYSIDRVRRECDQQTVAEVMAGRIHMCQLATLADAIDEGLESGVVRGAHKGAYQVGKQSIHGAEVDRWRKLRGCTSWQVGNQHPATPPVALGSFGRG